MSVQNGGNILHAGVKCSASFPRILDEFKLGWVRIDEYKLSCVEYQAFVLGFQMQFNSSGLKCLRFVIIRLPVVFYETALTSALRSSCISGTPRTVETVTHARNV